MSRRVLRRRAAYVDLNLIRATIARRPWKRATTRRSSDVIQAMQADSAGGDTRGVMPTESQIERIRGTARPQRWNNKQLHQKTSRGRAECPSYKFPTEEDSAAALPGTTSCVPSRWRNERATSERFQALRVAAAATRDFCRSRGEDYRRALAGMDGPTGGEGKRRRNHSQVRSSDLRTIVAGPEGLASSGKLVRPVVLTTSRDSLRRSTGQAVVSATGNTTFPGTAARKLFTALRRVRQPRNQCPLWPRRDAASTMMRPKIHRRSIGC